MGPPNATLFTQMDIEPHGKGILPSQDIRLLIDTGKIISPSPVLDKQIQPASIDLRLGAKAYQVRASFVSTTQSTVDKKIHDLSIGEIDLDPSAVLPKGGVFVVPLIESLALPPDVSGKANPKSTTGRLDIFTRLITEGGGEFERVPSEYSGKLYLEIVSRTFPIVVRKGMSLNQLRFVRKTSPDDSISDPMLARLARSEALTYEEDQTPIDEPRISRGLSVHVDLQGAEASGIVAYRAKHHAPPVDLARINFYEVAEYWDVIHGSRTGELVLDPGAFYIMASRERISVPPMYAAEMVPFDPSIGEFRIHYAGFFDPGFGYGVSGTKAVLEVRAHEIPILLENLQLVGKLNYHKLAAAPDKVYGPSIGSSYQQQGLMLSKQFKRETKVEEPISDTAPTLAPPIEV
jgi:dCTP deaminase